MIRLKPIGLSETLSATLLLVSLIQGDITFYIAPLRIRGAVGLPTEGYALLNELTFLVQRYPYQLYLVFFYDYRHADVAVAIELEDVFVAHPNAAFAAACSYALGEDGAVYTDVIESWNVQPEE